MWLEIAPVFRLSDGVSSRVEPLVSVVLPVFNGAGTLARAIKSIQGQSLARWELLAVDDGSTDDTPRVLADWAAAEPRIRILTQPRAGIVSALNTGLAAARGEYVARMDADDESLPERLAAQAEFLSVHPEIGLVGCLVAFGGNPAASAGYALHVEWMNSLVTPGQIARGRFVESPFAHPSVMFRREVVSRFGGYAGGEFPEDYELWLRWLDAGVAMGKVPRVLLRWNDPPARLSRTDPRYRPDAFFRMKARWIARAVARARCGREAAEPCAERQVWIWGAGRPTRKRAAYLEEHGVRIAGYVDIDPRKMTGAIGGTGRAVIGPAALPLPGKIFVLAYVSSRGARELIGGELGARGYVEGRDFLLCA